MILWWGKKKDKDPKTGETPIEPLETGAEATPVEAPPEAKKTLLGGLFGGAKASDAGEASGAAEGQTSEPSPLRPSDTSPASGGGLAPSEPPSPPLNPPPLAGEVAAQPSEGGAALKSDSSPAPKTPAIAEAQPTPQEPVQTGPPVDAQPPEPVAEPPAEPAEPQEISRASAAPRVDPAGTPEVVPEPVPDPTPDPAPDPVAETNSPGFFAKLTQGLRRSSSKLADGVSGVFTKRKLDDDALEELEDLLIASDLGAGVAARVASAVAKDRFDKDVTDDEIKSALAQEVVKVLKPREELVDFSDGPSPRIVLFVGVNGSGKTTTIGKIASKLSAQGANILLAAGDTFRAAAVEQLKVWSERAGAAFLSKPQGADSAGLAYDAVAQAKAEGRDLVLIDTAGRLQNRAELMDELAKVIRAIRKLDTDAPHDVILVLDATVGQNALSQVDAFHHTAGVTGLVMTKLDGTAKGGVLVAVADKYDLPIHFVGVGERAEDLHPFSADAFARALVGLDETAA